MTEEKLIAPNHTCTHMLNFAHQNSLHCCPILNRQTIDPEHLRRIESIVNEQIKAELNVFAKGATLADAKRVYPGPVRVVSIGQKVEDLLSDPENQEWSSISAELCGTVEGPIYQIPGKLKAFALLSEEGIAKGVRRITAVTTDSAFTMMDSACLLEQEVNDASKIEGSLLERKWLLCKAVWMQHQLQQLRKLISVPKLPYFSVDFFNPLDFKPVDTNCLIQLKRAQKMIAKENTRKAVKVAVEMAEVSASDGKAFCISHVEVGLDAAAVREVVLKVTNQKVVRLFALWIMHYILHTKKKKKKFKICASYIFKSN
ncbi:hypothetical protein Ddye_024293 [Dipteronia dyeriana]|uniref:alanine--tRNA ligase n=1 Tax=Dipteronia dyeriana TaxID=168575 RepID=A0AAD9TUJ2_9ROSI|nr:hypothetical protein Ddye_024293 [Dipteronia dyeriana]